MILIRGKGNRCFHIYIRKGKGAVQKPRKGVQGDWEGRVKFSMRDGGNTGRRPSHTREASMLETKSFGGRCVRELERDKGGNQRDKCQTKTGIG